MEESEEELKKPLMKMKGESEKAGLKPSIKKTKIIKLKQGLCINLEWWDGEGDGRGYMYTYGWFMLSFYRKQQNSVKQFSFNKK